MQMSDLLDDGYRGDVIGEATPDVILGEIVSLETIRVMQKLRSCPYLHRSIAVFEF